MGIRTRHNLLVDIWSPQQSSRLPITTSEITSKQTYNNLQHIWMDLHLTLGVGQLSKAQDSTPQTGAVTPAVTDTTTYYTKIFGSR